MKVRHAYIGDACLCWSLGETIDLDISKKVIQLYRQIKAYAQSKETGILDVVPAYNAVAVHFDPAVAEIHHICSYVDSLLDGTADHRLALETERKTHILPVEYCGPDLARVAQHCGLTSEEVIQYHTAGNYHVAMIGFKPHYPYLIGLDPRLETPRLNAPRVKVPAGAVAIGGAQTGVYPCESPGGWNLIGMTDPKLLIPVKAGDCICFMPNVPQGTQEKVTEL